MSKLREHHQHFLEMGFVGHSGAGKTTLINKIITTITATTPQRTIGYIKHDAHQFDMDRPGKDTFRAMESGAATVAINNKNKRALLAYSPLLSNHPTQKLDHLNCDFVLIEGFKTSSAPKILCLGEEVHASDHPLLKQLAAGELTNVVAIVGAASTQPTNTAIPPTLPYFNWDDGTNITAFILEQFEQLMLARPMIGLVLAGGHGERMGGDKGAIAYRDGVEQTRVCSQLLSRFCQSVYVSCRASQVNANHLQNLSTLPDEFSNMGPMGGLLTALKNHPNANILAIAVDLPLLDNATVELLVNEFDPFKTATHFASADNGLPEPLCAIYTPKAYPQLLQFLSMGYQCPRKVLINSNTKSLTLNTATALANANTPAEREHAKTCIQKTLSTTSGEL